jgi:cytoskeletal protein RodZ
MSDGDGAPHKGSKIGRTLELARKERGLSFKQVEEATKIRAGYLEELERENFDVLPAVYVQGSLKTYANFLQLDGEALVQELKRRQASQREPAYVEPRQDASDLPTIPLGTAAVVGSKGTTEDEEDAGWTLFPAGINHYLYLGVGAFLVLVAVVLALTLTGDRQPAVSQVREPLISQAPPEATPVEDKEDNGPQPQRKGEDRGAQDKGDGPQRERAAGPSDEDTGDESANRTDQTGQDDSRPAEDSFDTAATESAPPTAEPETTSTPPAAEEPAQRRSTGGPRRPPSDSRDGGEFDVRITAGSDDPVRITGGVPGD